MSDCNWHIHLGAHKTATTHIQAELAARQDELYSKGTFYLPLPQTREMLMFRTIPRPLWWRLARRGRLAPKAGLFASQRFAQICARQLQMQIMQEAGAVPRILMSEENLLGTTDQVFEPSYFNGSSRLNLLRNLSEQVPVHLYLSTRALDSFLPSAYAQALRSFPKDKLDLAGSVQRFADGAPSWAHLVSQIRKRVPRAEITLWDYADYAAHSQAVQSLLAGCPLSTKPPQVRPKRTQSPSADAIRQAEALSETDPKRRLRAVNAIYEAGSADGKDAPFRPIPPEMRQHLQTIYRSDLERIAAMPGVRFVRFGSHAPR